jgi:hypothetical protein
MEIRGADRTYGDITRDLGHAPGLTSAGTQEIIEPLLLSTKVLQPLIQLEKPFRSILPSPSMAIPGREHGRNFAQRAITPNKVAGTVAGRFRTLLRALDSNPYFSTRERASFLLHPWGVLCAFGGKA